MIEGIIWPYVKAMGGCIFVFFWKVKPVIDRQIHAIMLRVAIQTQISGIDTGKVRKRYLSKINGNTLMRTNEPFIAKYNVAIGSEKQCSAKIITDDVLKWPASSCA